MIQEPNFSNLQRSTDQFIDMSFGKKLEGLFNQGRAQVEERLAQHRQQQGIGGQGSSIGRNNPPPIPYATKPSGPVTAYCK